MSDSDTRAWTPGPWEVNPVTAQVDGITNGEPLAICQLLWPTDERSEAETEANAHLIAAAPELYEALKAFLEDERFQVGVGGNPIAVERMIANARTVLAKARGETP